jgi:hypothetical protein
VSCLRIEGKNIYNFCYCYIAWLLGWVGNRNEGKAINLLEEFNHICETTFCGRGIVIRLANKRYGMQVREMKWGVCKVEMAMVA